jgi:hypothetical protein
MEAATGTRFWPQLQDDDFVVWVWLTKKGLAALEA